MTAEYRTEIDGGRIGIGGVKRCRQCEARPANGHVSVLFARDCEEPLVRRRMAWESGRFFGLFCCNHMKIKYLNGFFRLTWVDLYPEAKAALKGDKWKVFFSFMEGSWETLHQY
jgi:hypothetical protein